MAPQMQGVPAQTLYMTPRTGSPVPGRPVGAPGAQVIHTMPATRSGGLQLGNVGAAATPAIAAAVANLISNASLRNPSPVAAASTSPAAAASPEKPAEEEGAEEGGQEDTLMTRLSQVYNDRTTGLAGCPMSAAAIARM
ncbi:unnamed protein product [Symbiodinium natans]|uniref:Uncharacterized protein n=1 Tax=Symbiodinium natans TaxID=878477 RepID=A0A812LL01_9DINO|nr:unnamed protein product [Symbiodinium natans]